jgi:hypothetical protein
MKIKYSLNEPVPNVHRVFAKFEDGARFKSAKRGSAFSWHVNVKIISFYVHSFGSMIVVNLNSIGDLLICIIW